MTEPIIKPIRAFNDSRGYSFFDIFGEPNSGQINVGNLIGPAVKGLHYHMWQWDHWFCMQGDIHIVLAVPKRYLSQSQIYLFPYNDSEPNDDFIIKHYYIGEHNPCVLSIPPMWSHGYVNVTQNSSLLYWVTKAYDPKNPDEHRLSWDKFGVNIWKPENK